MVCYSGDIRGLDVDGRVKAVKGRACELADSH